MADNQNTTNLADLRRQAKTNSVAQMGGGNVGKFFEKNKNALAAVLPKHMHADRMLKVAMHALRTTPALNECNVESLMGAVVQCSQLGLEPNTVLGHAYLLPFNNRRENRKDVQLIIGYKGLVDLARRSGQIETISAHAVHESDHFDLQYGTEPKIEHRPALSGEPGGVIGFYAVARFKDGGYQFEFMTCAEVDKIRNGSQGYQSAIRYKKDHPWISNYVQMGRKTVLRRLSNYLPLSIEFATAATLDGMAEGGQDQNLEGVLDGEYTVMPDDAPPADDDAPSDESSEQEQAPDPNAGDEQQAVTAGPFIERLENATSLEELDDTMAEASDTLESTEKARATKAYNRNKQRLDNDNPAQGLF